MGVSEKYYGNKGAAGKDRDRENRFLRLLVELGQGRRIVAVGSDHRLGTRPITPDDLRALLSRDVIGPCGEGAFAINEQGQALLRRLRADRRRRAAALANDTPALAVRSPFRDQHMVIERVGDNRLNAPSRTRAGNEAAPKSGAGTHWINRTESPLGWLRRRRDKEGRPLVTAIQVEAGERLRTDFELAGLTPRVTASWDGVPANLRKSAGYRDLNPTDVQVMARKRFSGAMTVLGPGLSDVAIHTCCLLDGLETCERRLGWPPRSAKVVLGLALDRLADYYGFEKKNHNGKK